MNNPKQEKDFSQNLSLGIRPEDLAIRFQELHRLSQAKYSDLAELHSDYVTAGCRLLDMEVGIISRIEVDTYTIQAVIPVESGMQVGQQFPLGDTYCSWVVKNAGTLAYEEIGADDARSRHPVYVSAKLEAYISTPIWVDGKIHGTLNFSDRKARKTPFSTADRELIELMALGIGQAIERDLLEQRRNLATLRMNENIEIFESAFKYASIGLALVAPDGRWLRVNNALCNIVGYLPDELLTIDFQTITHPDDLNTDLSMVQEMLAGTRDTYQMEKRYIHKDGHIIWILLSVSLVHNEDKTPKYFISQIQDISAQKLAIEELHQKQRQLEIANRNLEELAQRDSLTKLYNRRSFENHLEQERHRCQRAKAPLSLLMLDLDYFKQYNDKFGHVAGDEALQTIARVLILEARKSDFVARLGGEEFAIILPETSAKGSRQIAERILLAITEANQAPHELTASIGLLTVSPENIDLTNTDNQYLVQQADQALYQAKDNGRNCLVQKTL